jgi:hypothetical protein
VGPSSSRASILANVVTITMSGTTRIEVVVVAMIVPA